MGEAAHTVIAGHLNECVKERVRKNGFTPCSVARVRLHGNGMPAETTRVCGGVVVVQRA